MASQYRFNVNMYRNPPEGLEDLMKLIDVARERLKLYENLGRNEGLGDSPFRFLLQRGNSCDIQEARRIDHLSHWVLRIAHGKSFQLMESFVKYELEWFKMRFDRMENEEKCDFIKENYCDFNVITGGRLKYKIYFAQVPLLVKLRKYPLHGGYLYVPPHEIVHWLLNKLETDLRVSLIHIRKTLPSIDHEQLETILFALTLVKPSPISIIEPALLDDLDEDAKVNFPLCMRFQHETLRSTHHLKHFSRMQYGLFLKGIGLSLEESLKFWGDELTQDIPQERTWNRYSYLFKHQYGVVGSRINYFPYNCEKIRNQIVGPNQVHGCPYKHWDEEVLVNKLKDYKISEAEISKIVQLKNEERYSEACTQCFECFNHRPPDNPITHPNQYYTNSCKISKFCNLDSDMEDYFGTDSE